jgi:regulatory protein
VTGRDLSPTGEPAGAGARKAFERGLAAIRRRERGAAELAEWLAERDFTATDVNTAIAHLTEVGELDDRRFAKRFAEDKRELRGWGPERIREALMRRGIAGELIESALGTEDHETELARAERLLAQRAQPLGSDAERRRALAFLARRGYDLDLAYEAVRRGGREAA